MKRFDKIASSRLRDSLDADFNAGLVAERFMRATGQKTGGLTSFMADLALIGAVFNFFYHIINAILLFFVVVIALIIHVIRRWIGKPKQVQEVKEKTEIKTSFQDTTPEEDEEMYNSF